MFLLLRLGLSKHWIDNLFYDSLYRSIGCWSWAKKTAARSLETIKKEIVSRRLYAIRIGFLSREIRPDFLAVVPMTLNINRRNCTALIKNVIEKKTWLFCHASSNWTLA